MSTFLLIFILFILFVLFAFFSLAETAIFSTNRYRLRHLASEGNRRAAQLTEWLDQPEPLLATILLGSNFASIGAATLGATLVSKWVVDQNLLEFALIAEAVVLTLFVLLFCELGPKALAARYPDRIALQVVIPIELCMKLLAPLTKSGIRVAGVFFRHVKEGRSTSDAEPTTGAELRSIIAEAGNRDERMRMLE